MTHSTPRQLLTRRFTAIMAVLLLSTYHSGAMAERISASDEGKDAIAQFLLNFGRFIDWPEAAFASPSADFKLCVIGENHLGNVLEQNLRNKKAGERAFAITELSAAQVEEAKGCNILYISADEAARVTEITTALSGLPILTVGEVDGFSKSGGMIGLASAPGGKVAISIQKTLISSVNLQVREQLMRAIQ